MPTEAEVLDSLRHIMDPDLGHDIVSLGFVKNMRIEGGGVSFDLELTTPACPMKAKFKEACEEAVGALPGVESVSVNLTARQQHRESTGEIDTLKDVGAIVAVSSCKGGVGKSTVAAHLARGLQREGLSVGLLDVDVYGPSLPTLFKIHQPQVYIRDNKIMPVEAEGLKLMSLGFVLGEAPAVLRGPIVSSYTQQILKQTDWGKLDYLIIDLPPGTGDIQLTVVQQAMLEGAVIVTTPQALSLVDVAKGILMFEKVNVPVLGVVENMSSFLCDSCGAKHYPFGQSQQSIQQRFGLKTLAELPISRDIAEFEEGAGLEAIQEMASNVNRTICANRVERPEQAPKVNVADGAVEIEWSDGHKVTLSNHTLRCACPCALCVNEMTNEPLLDPKTVPEDIAIESVQNLGNYAVAFTWSDGHSTGIYAWDYLRSLG